MSVYQIKLGRQQKNILIAYWSSYCIADKPSSVKSNAAENWFLSRIILSILLALDENVWSINMSTVQYYFLFLILTAKAEVLLTPRIHACKYCCRVAVTVGCSDLSYESFIRRISLGVPQMSMRFCCCWKPLLIRHDYARRSIFNRALFLTHWHNFHTLKTIIISTVQSSSNLNVISEQLLTRTACHLVINYHSRCPLPGTISNFGKRK